MARIRAMGGEASSSISRSHDVGSGLTNLSRSDSVRRVLATPEGFRQVVPTGSGDLTLGVPRGPERTTPGDMSEGPLIKLRLMREQLENMTYQELDYEMKAYGIPYGPASTRKY
ncbi:MAG: hypothetical protein ACKPKO_05045 [Candidatus Fonsibacter sp.]